jgi:D-aminopeptidase
MRASIVAMTLGAAAAAAPTPAVAQEPARRSARELGVIIGILPPGPRNAITDVPGVLVGHTTVARGDTINTGVTAILPHGGNPFREKVPAAAVVGNGFGKLVGFTQVQELGELESPILLTCTLCVHRVADAALGWLLRLPGNEDVRSANVVVGETNDGLLNDIRLRPVSAADVVAALERADSGAVAQGSVGAGRGTVAFGWKGGIGTASRRLPDRLGGWTVGVLVQSNFGGILQINGAPVGEALGRHYLRGEIPSQSSPPSPPSPPGVDGAGGGGGGDEGSIMIVVATDAPLHHRNLERLAARALAGLARTGSAMTNGSGDYVIAFSTVSLFRRSQLPEIPNDAMSPLFLAAIEGTEEAIYNSLLLATTVRGHRGTVEALPLEATLTVLERHGAIRR